MKELKIEKDYLIQKVLDMATKYNIKGEDAELINLFTRAIDHWDDQYKAGWKDGYISGYGTEDTHIKEYFLKEYFPKEPALKIIQNMIKYEGKSEYIDLLEYYKGGLIQDGTQ